MTGAHPEVSTRTLFFFESVNSLFLKLYLSLLNDLEFARWYSKAEDESSVTVDDYCAYVRARDLVILDEVFSEASSISKIGRGLPFD